jgi:DNA-directed RNA polymerase specialized sigma24 family protein
VAVVVLAHDHGPPDAERFVGWCCAVARHVALHRLRSKGRAASLMEHLQWVEPPVDEGPEPVTATRRRLELGLDRLDDDAVSLLWNRFVLEETSVEIASRLNVSAASVRMRLNRLLAGVRESDKSKAGPSMERYGFDGSGNYDKDN